MTALDEDQIDVLSELVNIGMGRAAAILNQMVGHHITLAVPNLQVLSVADLPRVFDAQWDGRVTTIAMNFTGALTGSASMALPPQSASRLVGLLTGEPLGTYDLDAVRIETLSEVGNILINSVMGSISNMTGQRLEYTLPVCRESTPAELARMLVKEPDTLVLKVEASFAVREHVVEGSLLLVFQLFGLHAILPALHRQPPASPPRAP